MHSGDEIMKIYESKSTNSYASKVNNRLRIFKPLYLIPKHTYFCWRTS